MSSTPAVPAVAVALASAVVVAGLTVLAVTGGGGGLHLEVWDPERRQVAYARPLAPGETFDLVHVHSVHRRPVTETFSASAGDGIAVEEIRFDVSGANLPAGGERVGGKETTFVTEDGTHRVLHHGRAIGTLPLRVGGPDVDHTLIFRDGEQVRLLSVARRGGPVELRVARR